MFRRRSIRVVASLLAAWRTRVAGRAVSGGAAEISSADLDRIGADALATRKAPGFSLSVVRDGKLVYAKGFGLADVARNVAVTPRTRFAVGSLTKGFTAAGILLLAQRGKLALSDSLSAHLAGIPNGDVITLRMLLNQTSGLHNYPKLSEHAWPTAGAIPLSKIVSILATDRPDFAPGTRWEYSNANYALLGAVIAKAGQTGEAILFRDNNSPISLRRTAARERSCSKNPLVSILPPVRARSFQARSTWLPGILR